MGQSCRLPSVTQIDGRAVRALKADWKIGRVCFRTAVELSALRRRILIH